MPKIKQKDDTYKKAYTLDYALWKMSRGEEIRCPFGSLDDFAIDHLIKWGYKIEPIKDKNYRGTRYVCSK